MKNLILLPFFMALLMFSFSNLKSQETNTEVDNIEKKSSIDVGADLVSRYVWRGANLSTSPAIQPYIEYSFGGFTLGSWSSYTFAKEPFQEVDLYLSYNASYFTFTFTDYFFPIDSLFINNDYFNWNKSTTPHALEAILSVSDIPNLPLSFLIGVIIYGNDFDENGDNYYSTYMELDYDFLIGKNNANAFIGVTPFEGLYSDKFNVVNLGLTVARDVVITDKFILPLVGSFMINPDSENVYFVFGFSF